MPVRVTTVRDTGYDERADMAHFDEDRYALEKRVQRLLTDHAWTEDPPSRTRHLVTNVRTFAGPEADTIAVESSVLLFRSRGDDRRGRVRLRPAPRRAAAATATTCCWRGGDIAVEESVLRTQNLAVFL